MGVSSPQPLRPQPKETLREALRRRYRSAIAVAPGVRLFLPWVASVGLIAAASFIATTALDGWVFALEVLLGDEKPSAGSHLWASGSLAVAGYLLVPTLVGAAVGLAVQNRHDRIRQSDQEDFEELVASVATAIERYRVEGD
jgi:hypothetical protein